MSTRAAIEVEGLHKAYDGHEAVRGIGLLSPRGEVFELLGPNGAGKTIRSRSSRATRCAAAARSRCSATIRARRPAELRERVGIVLQSCGTIRT